ncbi:MAG: hypothetical protein DSM106950_13410 [Stigonema ocellatum SAG 48.90 = DSM 106950]|nr:hypothetical protein [Stigonema ocellatum SAG 48.90 = DSM 106950]
MILSEYSVGVRSHDDKCVSNAGFFIGNLGMRETQVYSLGETRSFRPDFTLIPAKCALATFTPISDRLKISLFSLTSLLRNLVNA